MKSTISEKIIEDFLENTSIIDETNITQKKAVIKVMMFLTKESSINSMIECSKMKQPALTGIVRELEDVYSKEPGFPFYIDDKNNYYTNRQNIGRMVKFIMAKFGYIPKESYMSERKRLSKYSESLYFSTAAIYEPNGTAEFVLKLKLKKSKKLKFEA